MRFLSIFILISLVFVTSAANALLCDPSQELCGFVHGHRTSGSPAKPSSSNAIHINPANVPTDKMIGIEGIYYKGEVDVSLARGLGRVGAAISPSNSEETFFGPPGLEPDSDLLDRKINKNKYPSQKITLATAVSLIDTSGSGFSKFSLSLGVMGKYHKFDSTTTGGGGVTGVWGPFSFGYSRYADKYHLSLKDYGQPDTYVTTDFDVESMSAGIYLGSVAVDYSLLELYMPNDRWEVKLVTASIFIKRGIFTVSVRNEDSARPSYSYTLNTLSTVRTKSETFLGAQLTAGSHLMIGAFYNYYLLREMSLSATLFF